METSDEEGRQDLRFRVDVRGAVQAAKPKLGKENRAEMKCS